jgi:hypothetical protein
MINRNNYEHYFIDYLEGQMGPEQEAELMLFLDQNPDLKEELDLFRETCLVPSEDISFKPKEELRKESLPVGAVNAENIDEKLIGRMEGNTAESELADIEEFLRYNPDYLKSDELLQKTRLQPDLSIVYPDKSELKRRKAPVIFLNPVVRIATASAAALLLIFLGIRFLMDQPAVPQREAAIDPIPRQVAKLDLQLNTPIIQNTNTTENIALSPVEMPDRTSLSDSRTEVFHMASLSNATVYTSGIYEDLALAGPYYRPVPELPPLEEGKERGLVGRVFANLFQKAASDIVPEGARQNRQDGLSGWSIARAGVQGYNMMADKDVALVTNKNDEGRVTSYSIVDNEEVVFTRDRRNKE